MYSACIQMPAFGSLTSFYSSSFLSYFFEPLLPLTCDQLCLLLSLRQDVTSNLLFVLTPCLLAISEEDIYYSHSQTGPLGLLLVLNDTWQNTGLQLSKLTPQREPLGPIWLKQLCVVYKDQTVEGNTKIHACHVLWGSPSGPAGYFQVLCKGQRLAGFK